MLVVSGEGSEPAGAENVSLPFDQVYKKAFNAAFMSAYRSTYKSALGKAEQVGGRVKQTASS